MAPERTLTVFCRAGLSNRLRLLVSGLAVAEASGRAFRMVWPRNGSCGAGFAQLFANDWPVVDVETLDPALAQYHVDGWSYRRAPSLLADPRPDIILGLNNWLVDPGQELPSSLVARCVELFAELAPLPAMRDRIDEFRGRHFGPTVIGAHVRRGDFLRLRPDVAGNTTEVLAAVDRFLEEAPAANIFLCTDDGATDRGRRCEEGVREVFRARYGVRVVSSTPRSLNRRTVEAVQDAVADLWLLRATQMVVGTRGSSFSALAVFGREVPHAFVGDGTPGYRRLERLVRPVGLHWLVRRLFRALHGYDQPFPKAWRALTQGGLRARSGKRP